LIAIPWHIGAGLATGEEPEARPIILRVEAGDRERVETPVTAAIPAARLRAFLLAIAGGPATGVSEDEHLRRFLEARRDRDVPWGWSLAEVRDNSPAGPRIPVEVHLADAANATETAEHPREPLGPAEVTWVLPGVTHPGEPRRFALNYGPAEPPETAWSFSDGPEGSLELKNRERTVFRYNRSDASHPNYPAIQRRSAYIHPAFTPSGALITGDFSRAHPHHRGFFLAYTKTQIGDAHPDFWNIHGGTGKVKFDRLGTPEAGPVTARFSTYHRWDAKGAGEVLRERWDVTAYDIPGSPYWLFDLTSTQQATARPVELVPYRYGGMAYRGPDSFLPRDVLDVLTSEGLGRRDGDQKPARWVDLTGPIADGSRDYAGAMIADHPSNAHHPTVARIHPTSLPFFCFVPAHDAKVVIGTGEPTVFRYRVLIHDGRPDQELDERIWRDFAEPPTVAIVGDGAE
jgi:hypothetical protein